MNVARLVARTVIGGLFIGHGTQKLGGWFGGPGLEGTAGMMESLRLHPPRRNAVAAGAAETGGGALLALGLATPLASSALIGTMITAIRKVHWSNGPWVSAGGYEYNLVLIAALLALAEDKPGDLSVDRALGWNFTGLRWSLAALGIGAAASAATVWLGENAAPEQSPVTGESATTPTDQPGDPSAS
ncbi:MAG: DoxX family protein [Nocardioidaceae bacterium]